MNELKLYKFIMSAYFMQLYASLGFNLYRNFNVYGVVQR